MNHPHYIQIECLFELSQVDHLRFSQFSTPQKLSIEKDKFNYHLQQLVKLNLIKKNMTSYSLTTEGKQLIGRYDFANKQPEKYPKLSVMIRVFQNEHKDTLLVSKRLKHPCLNQYTLVTGKIKRGEDFEEAMKRECFEETGLAPTASSFIGIRRIFDYDTDNNLLHDAIFFEYEVTSFDGELISKTAESENKWIPIREIISLDNALSSVKNVLKPVSGYACQNVFISEEKYILNSF